MVNQESAEQTDPQPKTSNIEGWRKLLYLGVWLGGILDVILILINWDELAQIRDRYLSQASPPVSFDPLYTAFKWAIVWSLLIWLLWLSRLPLASPRYPRARLRYLLGWIIGLIVLMSELPWLIDTLVPAAAPTLTSFTAPAPLLLIWSLSMFLLFLYRGDNSVTYDKYLRQYQGVWTALSVVMVGTVLTGYTAYQGVRARIDGDLSNQTLLRSTVQQLQTSLQATGDIAEALVGKVDEGAGQNTNALLDDLPTLRLHATSSHLWVQAASDQVGRAIETQKKQCEQLKQPNQSVSGSEEEKVSCDQLTDSLRQIADVLTQTVSSTQLLTPTAQTIAQTLAAASTNGSTLSQSELIELKTQINTGLIQPIQDANLKISIVANSIAGVHFNGLTIYLWLGAFYTVLVLLPWVLLLLFLYRKRTSRATQIYKDLEKLDRNLLQRVLSSQEDHSSQQKKQARQLNSPDQRTNGVQAPTDVGQDSAAVDEIGILTLANQAFSNFEYILSLLVLSLLTAVGWYYVFFPRTSLGLAYLIEIGSGIKELSAYLIRNLTPLTMGFAGAYFFAAQALVRRYLYDDLYPSAFLQAALRLLLVFILGLALNLLFVTGQLVPSSVGSLIAFFAGIFPRWGLRFITTQLNKLLHQIFSSGYLPENIEDVSLTKLDGISIWIEERLVEEKIENVQSLATAPIEELIIGTHFSTMQIVDWMDQALFYLHAGDHGEWFIPLRRVGIRTASDLLDAAMDDGPSSRRSSGDNGKSDAGYTNDFEPKKECLKQLVQAVNEAPADTDTHNRPQLTEAILDTICEALWPDPNVWYIRNFYQQIKQKRPDSKNDGQSNDFTREASGQLLPLV